MDNVFSARWMGSESDVCERDETFYRLCGEWPPYRAADPGGGNSDADCAGRQDFCARRKGRADIEGSAGVIVAIIQARMGSSRLPGKTIADVAGRPLLLHVVERVQRARRVDKVVVATTDQAADDPIATLCQQGEIQYFR